MNDLERDLSALFHERAGSIDASPTAPAEVLRRARRRRVVTVIGGAAALLVVALAVVFVARTLSAPTASVPAHARYGERTATIEGTTITAPEGWTLVDDWPLGASLDAGTASTSAGRPLFQLANFEPPLLRTVCGLGPDSSARFDLSGDQAILYVALDEGDPHRPGATAPSHLDPTTAPTQGPCGSGWYARWLVGGTGYLAYAGFGPDVRADDRTSVFDAFSGMEQAGVPGSAPEGALPGYVIAAGVGEGGAPWRIDAGLTRLEPAAADPTSVGAWLVRGVTYGTQPPPREQPTTPPEQVTARFDPFDHEIVQWGTAVPEVAGIDIVADDGTTAATTLPWPDALRTYAADPASLDGSIWFAVVSTVGHVQVHTTGSLGTPAQADWTTGGELPTVVIGGTTEATFDAFGVSWTITDDENGVTLQRSFGGETSFHELINGEGIQIDVPGGTFVLEQTDPGIDRVSVSVDGGGTVEGRWMQTFRDAAGRPGRVWVVPLDGAGTGTSQVGDSPPLALSWPSHPAPTANDVLMGSSDDGVSWSLRWSPKDCPVVVIDQPADGGTSDCLEPVRDASKGISTVEMVAGTGRGAMAFVVPTGLTLDVTATSGSPAPVNYDLTNGRWKGTSIWVMTMHPGTTYTAQARDASGQPVGTSLTITPGSSSGAGPSG
jgi:hypothetical protein